MKETRQKPLFPRWANWVLPAVLFGAVAGAPYGLLLVGLGAAPSTTDIGYQPKQPIAYSHELHVNKLGLDCRYCHNTVETSAYAAIPPTETCMNCHRSVRKNSPKLEPLYASFRSGKPVLWKKVHDLPDYVYFNHSAHVNKGVSCATCHGRVDHMDGDVHRVSQQKELSMGWCLSCHRDPAPNLRPKDQVTNLGWDHGKSDAEKRQLGEVIRTNLNIKTPKQMADCSICHR